MKKLPTFLPAILLATAAIAQPSPYAGEQSRAIKALSEAEVADYLAGHGRGLARAAELNSYPGPRHVLDLGTELELTPVQLAELDRIFAEMKAAAQPLGRQLVDHEKELDRLFVSRTATKDGVAELTARIGRLQGELRAVHLNAHVATVALLRPAQAARYDELRGYQTASPAAGSAAARLPDHRHD